MVAEADVRTGNLYIDGQWTPATDGKEYYTVNPATEEPLGPAPNASRDDMRRAIQAARRAFDEGPWPRMSRAERYRIIRQIADEMERRHEELSRLVVAEIGAPLSAASQAGSITMMHDFAELALKFDFEETLPPQPAGPGLMSTQVIRQPVGVCGLIPTWNGPLLIAVRKIAPALAAGCTMVVKASPYTPLTVLKLAEIIDQTDLPKGVLNVVTGESVDISEELVANPQVDMISFTGGLATGKRIMEMAAGTLKRLTLELGGKSPNIILDDVDPAEIAPRAAAPACANAGQVCSALTRILAPRRLHDELLEGMTRALAGQKLGDPTDSSVTMGPLIREERRQAVERHIQIGMEEGASLITGGRRPPHLQKGFFLEPTVFADVRNDMRIAQEEIFGPVLAVMPYDDVDEAVRIANDSVYGLQANVTCRSVARGLEVAKRIRSGAVSINGALDAIRSPRGGFKQSGFGRECGKWPMDDYTEYQAVT